MNSSLIMMIPVKPDVPVNRALIIISSLLVVRHSATIKGETGPRFTFDYWYDSPI